MKQKQRPPAIFIFSGPGGAGKTTLVAKLFRKRKIREKFLRTISVTSRLPRPGEKEGKDYFFVTKQEFLKLEKKNFFLEHEKVLTEHYGTPRSFYLQAKKEKKGLILCIDVKGGANLKKKLGKEKVITVFVSAPDEKELARRLNHRRDDSDKIKKRLRLAKKELQFLREYDYLIINKSLDEAVKEAADIVLNAEGNV